MKVLLDLDPRDVWRFEEKAERRRVTPSEVVRDELARQPNAAAVRDRIRELVASGHCDADIAATLHYVPGRIAEIRRGMGLEANPRYRRTAA